MNKASENFWLDVHTHLHLLKSPPEEALQTAQKKGVEKIITIGTSPSDWGRILEDMEKLGVYGALGCHPHEAKHYTDVWHQDLKEKLQTKGILALGEIGLDYYYKHSEPKIQREVFRRQMELASQMGLPVEIHSRSAEEDTLEVLRSYKGRVRGLLHCFTGPWEMARQALDIGYNISFSGIVTFKNAEALREVCLKTPQERLHIETDAPYLAPEPHRGRANEPAWLIHTAEKVSSLLGIELSLLKEKTWNNARELFPAL